MNGNTERQGPGWAEAVSRAYQRGLGEAVSAELAYDCLTVDVPADRWLDALRLARDELGARFFDWLSAVDELDEGFSVVARVCAVTDDAVPPRAGGFLLRTRVTREAAELASAVEVYRGADWHERETHEMFGITFVGHPNLVPLLLPDGFEGRPLRKDFVLASRVAKAWPGAKEPGESTVTRTARRRIAVPGVPDDWLRPLPADEEPPAGDHG